MIKPKTPCYGCQDRVTCCHSKCERYANYRAKLSSFNAATKDYVYTDWKIAMKPKKNKKRLSGYET